jgi:diguanylate cyclase (GGDEF)-like protein/PAS domain S-box-containing protein
MQDKNESVEQIIKEAIEQGFIEAIGDAVSIQNTDFNILYQNQAHKDIIGDHIGEYCYRAYEKRDHVCKGCPVAMTFQDGCVYTKERSAPTDRGTIYVEITSSPLRDKTGKIIAGIEVVRDITDRKRMEDKLRAAVITDDLTGILNRRGFFTLADQQLKIAKRLNKEILILSADMDNLKEINDALGHKAGDSALIDMANIIRSSFRESDIIGRIGGDEFAVLQMDRVNADINKHIARLHKNIEKFNEKRKGNYKLSLSVGAVRNEAQGSYSLEELLIEADKFMYNDKRSKKKS